jgi:hypothetical protein
MICFDCSRNNHESCKKREELSLYTSCFCQHKEGLKANFIVEEKESAEEGIEESNSSEE